MWLVRNCNVKGKYISRRYLKTPLADSRVELIRSDTATNLCSENIEEVDITPKYDSDSSDEEDTSTEWYCTGRY